MKEKAKEIIGILFEDLGEHKAVSLIMAVLVFSLMLLAANFLIFGFVLAMALSYPLGVLVSSLVSPFIGKICGSLYDCNTDCFSKPQPAYSLPDGLAATGQNACAIMAYNELAKNHPEEILPHLRVMRIWIEKMNDVDAAITAYNLALKTIRGQKNRNEFVKMAKNNFSKFIQFA